MGLPRRCHGASRSEYANLAVPSALISRLCAIADLSFLFSRFRLLYQNLWVLSSLSEITRLDNFIRKIGGTQHRFHQMAEVRRGHQLRVAAGAPRSPVGALIYSGCGIMRDVWSRRFVGSGEDFGFGEASMVLQESCAQYITGVRLSEPM